VLENFAINRKQAYLYLTDSVKITWLAMYEHIFYQELALNHHKATGKTKWYLPDPGPQFSPIMKPYCFVLFNSVSENKMVRVLLCVAFVLHKNMCIT
jgi:hypothetical protein